MAYKHGHRRSEATSPTWISWRAMIARCHNPGASDYVRYGGAGITVCDRWRESFQAFVDDVGERPDEMTLDRIDPAGHYEPGNVRWATSRQQGRNRRTNKLLTFQGRTLTEAEWAEETGISRAAIAYRLRKGWSVEDALTTPIISRAERGLRALRARGVIDPGGPS
jgi:hypothetical protein